MEIKALGGCCKKSMANYEAVKSAVVELALDVEVEHVIDTTEILNLGVMRTPALIINNKIVCSGKALNVKQAIELIKKYSV